MKNTLTALAALVIALASCQKEPSFEDPNSIPGGGTGGGGTTTGTKLVRIGSRVSTDTVTTDYTYNSAGRLVMFVQAGVFNGTLFTAQSRYVRNAAGIITSIINKNDALAQFGLDSVEGFITYDAANTRYKHSITSITYLTGPETDSVVYVYTAGKLTAAIDYYDDGSGYVPYSKEEYIYSGANLSQVKSYEYDDQTSAYVLLQTTSYEYDAKTNPVQFAADAPVISMTLFYSANNVVKRTVVETNPAGTTVVTSAITYNTANRPTTVVTSSSGAVTSTSNYSYQ